MRGGFFTKFATLAQCVAELLARFIVIFGPKTKGECMLSPPQMMF